MLAQQRMRPFRVSIGERHLGITAIIDFILVAACIVAPVQYLLEIQHNIGIVVRQGDADPGQPISQHKRPNLELIFLLASMQTYQIIPHGLFKQTLSWNGNGMLASPKKIDLDEVGPAL